MNKKKSQISKQSGFSLVTVHEKPNDHFNSEFRLLSDKQFLLLNIIYFKEFDEKEEKSNFKIKWFLSRKCPQKMK